MISILWCNHIFIRCNFASLQVLFVEPVCNIICDENMREMLPLALEQIFDISIYLLYSAILFSDVSVFYFFYYCISFCWDYCLMYIEGNSLYNVCKLILYKCSSAVREGVKEYYIIWLLFVAHDCSMTRVSH